MEADKSLVSGSMALLVLKLLEDGDKYGYQMTSELRQRSEDVFHLKAGTLYPLLHSLEEKGLVTAALERLIQAGNAYDEVIAIGPLVMMKFVCAVTKKYGIKTVVSMNPL